MNLLVQLKDERKNEGAYEIGNFLKKKVDEKVNIKDEAKQLFLIRIYSFMGEFQYY